MKIRDFWASEGVFIASIIGLGGSVVTVALGIDGFIPPVHLKYWLFVNGSVGVLNNFLTNRLGSRISASSDNSTTPP